MDCRPDLLSLFCCCLLGLMFSASCLLSSCMPSSCLISCFNISLPVWQFTCMFYFDCLPTSSEVLLSISCSHMYTNIYRIFLYCLPLCVYLTDCLCLLAVISSAAGYWILASLSFSMPVAVDCGMDLSYWSVMILPGPAWIVCLNDIMPSCLSDWLHSLAKL